MGKKILLAVDDSVHSKNAVIYAAKIAPCVKDLSYLLLNIQSCVSQFLEDEAKTNFKAKTALEKAKKQNEERSAGMLEKYKAQMIASGIDASRIALKSLPRKTSLAHDILTYAQEGLYDAVLVGRRGISWVQEMFTESLSADLADKSKLIPVWVVDGDITSTKIMIATDGSESSLRAVDHLSFMVGHNPDVRITLFHVVPKLKDFCRIDFDEADKELEEVLIQGNKRCVESFLAHAFKKFKDSGIEKEQIEIREVTTMMNVGKAIAEEAQNRDYGTVVLGRRGISKAFYMGSVSQYVLDNMSNRAVWLCG
ncbi:MAG: hypothetical protein BWK80_26825 [Desulfobacteraceae bacterium IS3]|nr:MAG: hypothetical protein BWK80_26825 [Desulfobacteraceae bacterium IS3]